MLPAVEPDDVDFAAVVVGIVAAAAGDAPAVVGIVVVRATAVAKADSRVTARFTVRPDAREPEVSFPGAPPGSIGAPVEPESAHGRTREPRSHTLSDEATVHSPKLDVKDDYPEYPANCG